jgi:hypothetical protein
MEAASLARIVPYLEPVVLKLGVVVCEAGGLLKHAYFPQGRVLSLLTVLENGSAIETANIGRREPSTCSRRCTAASPSTDAWFNSRAAWFAARSIFCNQNSSIANMFAICLSAIPRRCSQVQQIVACNAPHSTERMCRWLLMMHDRAEGEALPYPHEFLSHMLGANRKSVTLAAQSLQTAGLISYRPGENPGRRSRRPRTGLVRVLRRRQGAV